MPANSLLAKESTAGETRVGLTSRSPNDRMLKDTFRDAINIRDRIQNS